MGRGINWNRAKLRDKERAPAAPAETIPWLDGPRRAPPPTKADLRAQAEAAFKAAPVKVLPPGKPRAAR